MALQLTLSTLAFSGVLAADQCSKVSDMYQCHYNYECVWCASKNGGKGRCANFTHTPSADETCDALVGCDRHRTNGLCDADDKCKWCNSYEQGWPFCTDIGKDESGGATCDKKRSEVSDQCHKLGDIYQCHYNYECVWCASKNGGRGRCTNFTHMPAADEACDALVGCDRHRTHGLCDADDKCKWCNSYEQGWPFCTDIGKDESGGATCDKKRSAVSDQCSNLSDMYQCHYNYQCVWCASKNGGKGRCASFTHAPSADETCDALVGCDRHRTNGLCDADDKCKWCNSYEQGWPFCTDIGKDESGSATCDKTGAIVV